MAISGLLKRTGVEHKDIDHVICGTVIQVYTGYSSQATRHVLIVSCYLSRIKDAMLQIQGTTRGGKGFKNRKITDVHLRCKIQFHRLNVLREERG